MEKTRKRIETPNANRYGNHPRRMRTRSGSYFKEKISLYFKTDKDLLIYPQTLKAYPSVSLFSRKIKAITNRCSN